MLIAALLISSLKWIALGVAFILVMWMRVDGIKLKPIAGIVVALIVGFGPSACSRPVVIVRDDGVDTTFTKRRLFGTTTYRFADSATAQLTNDKDDTLVVNDSDGTLQVRTITYGTLRLPTSPTAIPPYSATASWAREIDYFGPKDAPPHSISVNKKTSSGFEIRHWLTW